MLRTQASGASQRRARARDFFRTRLSGTLFATNTNSKMEPRYNAFEFTMPLDDTSPAACYFVPYSHEENATAANVTATLGVFADFYIEAVSYINAADEINFVQAFIALETNAFIAFVVYAIWWFCTAKRGLHTARRSRWR